MYFVFADVGSDYALAEETDCTMLLGTIFSFYKYLSNILAKTHSKALKLALKSPNFLVARGSLLPYYLATDL